MIFPFLKGIISFRSAPVTWGLVLVNALVVVLTLQMNEVAQKSLDKKFQDDYYLDTQGRLYAQFIKEHPEEYSPVLNELAGMVREGDQEKVSLLGSLAVRNAKFMKEAQSFPFQGDQVAIEYWRKKILEIKEVQSVHPSYVLGLSSADLSIGKWFSYIFVHSGFVHFAGNMIFLIIFGGMIEPVIGGLATLLVFLISGLFAAVVFVFLTGATAAPLVGASGAVSGLMALVCAVYRSYPVRFVYWLYLPFRGYSGFVYLPAWVILGMWVTSDIAGWLGTLNEMGGVAYSAHLGGEVAGVAVGLLIYFFRYNKRESLFPRDSQRPEVGKLYPFHQMLPSQNFNELPKS